MSNPIEEKSNVNQLLVKNPHLSKIEDDVLFHIGIHTNGGRNNLKEQFGDVKVSKLFHSLHVQI